MNQLLQDKLALVHEVLNTARKYEHAIHIMNFDQATLCPKEAMESSGETIAFLGNQAFQQRTRKDFVEAVHVLYEHREELAPMEQVMLNMLHRQEEKERNLTPEQVESFSITYNQAFVQWLTAKEQADFSLFAPALQKVLDVKKEEVAARVNPLPDFYDNLLNDFERGVSKKDLDECFTTCRDALVPLLKKIQASPKKIRTDFLSREVTDEQQKQMTEYLMKVIGFDFSRGAYALSEHPFTDGMDKNDIRITTHFYPNMFYSNMYSVIHEGGHALFEMNQPAENYDYHIDGEKTMGQHESVSRFYENVIGRSRAFIHLIYPKAKEIFPQVFCDVTEEEFYEAMNLVQPSLIRTEADEFTYIFHIIIRYELEKELTAGTLTLADLPAAWNRKYEEYLGVTPENDRVGVLQDVHWTSDFGYFPSYALGSMYNAMYYNAMKQAFDPEEAIANGELHKINDWMKEHVYAKADQLAPKDWIREITGRDFTTDDFLNYIREKYCALYEIEA